MKTSQSLALVSLLSSAVLAFPHLSPEAIERLYAKRDFGIAEDELPHLLKEKRAREAKRATLPVPFNAEQQYVSTTGQYKFVAPDFAAGDQRGPCPGLNAAANHGYLPHNGVADIPTIIEGVNKAYGMAIDLGGFLAVYGTVFDGNPLSLDPGYSIGGPTDQSPNILGSAGLLGTPQGLSGSHNKYESDASPTRGDLYMYGNDYKVQVHQFQQYYDGLIEGVGAPTQYYHLLDYRITRFQDSLQHNGYFFYSPFAGILVSPAGYAFPPAMMSNHSAEYPEGQLSKQDLMSFFSITGTSGNFKYTYGHERIPDNWYKRAVEDQYTIPGFLADVLEHGIRYPQFLDVTANTGKPNTPTFIDLGNLTKGVFDTGSLVKGNNLECFAFQVILAAGPDILDGLFQNPLTAMSPLTDRIASQLAGKACPKLHGIDTSQYNKAAGYKRSHGAV